MLPDHFFARMLYHYGKKRIKSLEGGLGENLSSERFPPVSFIILLYGYHTYPGPVFLCHDDSSFRGFTKLHSAAYDTKKSEGSSKMDKPIIISLVILAVITAVEFLCLYLCRKSPERRPPLTAVVPVFSDEEVLAKSLSHLRDVMLYGGAPIEKIILIDYAADERCKAQCEGFCRDFNEASVISPEELEKILAEMFAIGREK